MENSPLRGRYKIVKNLGRGGFGETYLAKDLERPGHPNCVVKKLHATFNSAKDLETAKRFFETEAQVLYNLGDRHGQIPQLLAHFGENNEFYLVQDFIEGRDLGKEIVSGTKWNEIQVISFLKDILGILEIVHQQKVIHRDIKPANIIRRKQDGKMVLIDFGAVKELQTVVHPQGNSHLTVGIGTQGYMPLEQRAGKPRFNSDIYAVGMTAIQAVTGIAPEKLPEDTQTEEVRWREQAKVSDRLANILDRMVKSHYRDRFQSVGEVLQVLNAENTLSPKTVTPQSSSNQVGGSTFIPSNETQQQSVTTKQPSAIGNPPAAEPKPKHSFGLAIALAVIGAVASTLGALQLFSFLQSKKPANQPVAQAPPPPIAAPTEIPVESPSPLPLASSPEVSPSVLLETPIASSIPSPQGQLETSVASPVLSASQNAVPLINTKCLSTTASGNSESFVKGSEDVTIGQEVVTAVAVLSDRSNYIRKDSAAGAACLIASPNSNTRFRKLKLTFGISNTNNYSGTANDSAVVSLTIYLDRQKIGSKEVKRGEKQFWEINVTNTQNVAVEAECLKPKRYGSVCPSVVFTQADLE
jgi:eukaryotic-like serine/threonine-protein kinase